MLRLKNKHQGERAIVILGGPSLIEHRVDFSALRRKGDVVFLEAKGLTPRFLESGCVPDYYLMPFPGKAKDNTLQSTVFRGFLAGVSILPFLKAEFRPVARELKDHFDRYYEDWRPHRGAHKRFRIRPDVYLPGSPFDLLKQLPNVPIIAHRQFLSQEFPSYEAGPRTHLFDTLPPAGEFRPDKYFEVVERDGVPCLAQFTGVLNSAAISVYPLLHYMGFREVFCLGMDMSMLGSMEYAVPYTFSSMLAFRWFFYRTRHVFNANYRPNRPYFYRPASEFEDLKTLVTFPQLKITRVHTPWKYAADVPGMPTVSLKEFL